jgi:hypothetical protein
MAIDAAQVLKQVYDSSTGSLKIVVNGYLWTKYTKTYADFSTGATTNNIELFSLPAGGIVHAVKIKHSTYFRGGAISAYTISVGIAASLAKYAAAYSVYQATGDAVFQIAAVPSTQIASESHAASTSVRAAATSTGANLSAATSGVVDIWVLTSLAV